MSKQGRFPNPFRFIYKHSGILAPAREHLKDTEDAGDYALVGVYFVVVAWCLCTAAMFIPLNQLFVVLGILIVLVAIKLVRARRR